MGKMTDRNIILDFKTEIPQKDNELLCFVDNI